MSKIAVVYWSGTGHTQAMAEAVAQGCGGTLFTAEEFDPKQVGSFDALAFGCPSMGAEQLEETQFDPMFQSCKPYLSGKKLALFGSYGWGDGEWMRNWEQECREAGALLAAGSVICQDDPDSQALCDCRALGAALQ